MYIASSDEGLEIVLTQTANARLWIQGQWTQERKNLCSPPISFSHLAFAAAALKSPSYCKKEKLPVSFWKFSAELLLRTSVQQWLRDAAMWRKNKKKHFLAKRNKFKQIGTQEYCLKWVLLHVRQGDGWDLQLKTKSPTDEADICVLQLSFHWHFECPYECLLC